MISRICICCGEAFCRKPNEAVDNPNLCLACSQITDEADADWELECVQPAPQPVAPSGNPMHPSTNWQEVTGC